MELILLIFFPFNVNTVESVYNEPGLTPKIDSVHSRFDINDLRLFMTGNVLKAFNYIQEF